MTAHRKQQDAIICLGQIGLFVLNNKKGFVFTSTHHTSLEICLFPKRVQKTAAKISRTFPFAYFLNSILFGKKKNYIKRISKSGGFPITDPVKPKDPYTQWPIHMNGQSKVLNVIKSQKKWIKQVLCFSIVSCCRLQVAISQQAAAIFDSLTSAGINRFQAEYKQTRVWH